MKGLSVRAPWWWAILHLGKPVENRDWYTTFRGTVYLHAGKWFSATGIMDDFEDVRWMREQASPELVPPFVSLHMLKDAGGCLVGKVDIVDCVSHSSSPWFVGKYGFVLANPVAFARPIPFKGALGFFEVPDGIEDWDSPGMAEA